MEISRHWRLKKVRYGNPNVWKDILKKSNLPELNPNLNLAHYASSLSDAELLAIHDRKKEGMKEKVIYERKL